MLLTPARRQDPYPLYEQILAEAPISDGPNGMVVVARYADCARLLRDSSLSSDYTNGARYQQLLASDGLDSQRLAEAERRWLAFRDPPEHTRQLRLVMKALVPRLVEAQRRFAQRLVDELLDQALGEGTEMDLVEDLALALPMRVISGLLGVPTEDYTGVYEWSRTIARRQQADVMEQSGAFDPLDALAVEEQTALLEAHAALIAYFDELIAARRMRLGEDLVSRLIAAEDSGDRLTTPDINSICQLMIGGAGVETTVNLIANGMLALLRNQDELDRLRNDPTLIGTAVDEVLRYDSPVQYVQRFALADVDVCGRTVQPGQSVILLLAAANRDPERFVDANRFDVGRTDNPHLGFGAGIHFCIGARLARMEGQIAIETLVRRLVKPALVDDLPTYKEHLSLRGPAALPIHVADLLPAQS